MLGLRIRGFVVDELLGSGRVGLIYRATHHKTGQQAILRVLSTEDGVQTKLFLEEAVSHLSDAVNAPTLINATLENGQKIQLALGGEWATTDTATQQSLPHRRNIGFVLFPGLAVATALLVFLVLKHSAPEALPPLGNGPQLAAAAAPPAQVAVAVSPSVVAAPAEDGGDNGGKVNARPGAVAASPEAPGVSKPNSTEVTAALPGSPSVVAAGATRRRSSTQGAPAAPKVESQAPCTFDDRFRDYARRTRSQLREMRDKNTTEPMGLLDDRLGQALVDRNCVQANTVLDEMRILMKVPLD